MHIDEDATPEALRSRLAAFWPVSGAKIEGLCGSWDPRAGSPVFTVRGHYTSQGWTEWTQGFQFGWAILQFDATGDDRFLELGRSGTVHHMASHVSHVGVHDHGFNNVSTYGNLRRLMLEGRIDDDPWQLAFYELALKVSGAVQAARWRTTRDGDGYIFSFNGPQSLFSDTIRSVRALSLAHLLGHRLMGENDEAISLLGRGIEHARTTARYNVFYGEGRDIYDEWGRVAHESVFNTNDGRFRTSSTQQGYAAWTTWTRGLAWVMAGYAEELEFLEVLPDADLEPFGGRDEVTAMMLRAARASCDFFIANTPTDGIPYWDTGAPGLAKLGDYLGRPADPFNAHEPVDSSAAAIGAQGLLRLGRYLSRRADPAGARYTAAGLGVLGRLLEAPYLSTDPGHEGLMLHGVYHRPRGWDHCPTDSGVPSGEAVMWGDYHLVEAALMVQRMLDGGPEYTFFGPVREQS
ncbi:MAG: glycosyl hydrolase [Chloroflexi bacterium RBG_16_72_14]|nr:MAG: glycosyl hydrolase [Chloroflexi bacterium RBG_16_72_14]